MTTDLRALLGPGPVLCVVLGACTAPIPTTALTTAPTTAPALTPTRVAQPVPSSPVAGAEPVTPAPEFDFKARYTKRQELVPMRDGVRLYTQIYSPRDASGPYPILMNRTPYSVRPYGDNEYPDVSGSMEEFLREGYILVRQDVRGKYMSEGEFVNMTPHIDTKAGPGDVDASSDTYDTIEWLLQNVQNHNGRVGQWGISYPGFYASAGMIDAHPALKAVSPQAPIGDWYFDDFFHHGAFFLPHTFGFFSGFGKARPKPTTEGAHGISLPTPDGYQFYLDLGPMSNIESKWYKGEVAFWTEVVDHPAYDRFWQSRRILNHLHNTAPAVMTVGGWYDAEDLYGALNTYRSIEEKNPDVFNMLVMGPWGHGDWGRRNGRTQGNIDFEAPTSEFYQRYIESTFFRHFLKDACASSLPEAYVYETGANRWRTFDHWPPAGVGQRELYFHAGGEISFDAPSPGEAGTDEFISDPARPVPCTDTIDRGMRREYMTDDQRFASRRPDVLTYRTPPLETDLTLVGPLTADLIVSTTGTDSDWIVKLIDVHPDNAKDPPSMAPGRRLAGYQQMVRSEVFRARYRECYEHPTPMTPDTPTLVRVPLQDVLHTFKKGHRLMVQVQSTWFPLVDRNPQKYVDNIFKAKQEDFIRATHRLHRGAPGETSVVRVGVIDLD